MIEALTQEQQNLFPVYVEKWLKIGLSTETLPFEETKEIIDEFYEKVFNLPIPSKIMICDSPLSAWELVQDEQSGNQLDSQLENQLDVVEREDFGSHLLYQCEDRVFGKIGEQIVRQLENPVFEQVGRQFESPVFDQVRNCFENFVDPYLHGQFDAPLGAYWDYMGNVFGLEFPEAFRAYMKTFNLGPVYPFRDICYVCKKPISIEMINGAMHSIKYADGFSIDSSV